MILKIKKLVNFNTNMKNVKIIFFIFCLITVSCKKAVKETKGNYEIKLETRNCIDNKNDTAVIFFESHFNNDLVQVSVNNKEVFKGTITTDETLGYAKDVNLGNIKNISTVKININKGKDVLLDKLTCNYIFVNHIKDSVVSVKFDNKFVPYQ